MDGLSSMKRTPACIGCGKPSTVRVVHQLAGVKRTVTFPYCDDCKPEEK